MQRWYQDRIGGMFTANAEALADRALVQPSVGMAEVGFNCEPSDRHYTRASLWLNEEGVYGWAKVQDAETMGRQLLIGSLATLLGAPSAPYLYIRGLHQIFSPDCIAAPHQLGNMETAARYRRLPATALGAAGQFRIWINDTDGLHNMATGRDGGFYLYDHDVHPEWDDTVNPQNAIFIADGLEAACELNGGGASAYMQGALVMAQRIAAVKAQHLSGLADRIRHRGGLTVSPEMVAFLCERTEMMREPQIDRAINHACRRRAALSY